MKYVITGTGRCGTGYIAQVLCSADVKCTHEQVFTLQGLEYAKEQIRLRRKYPWWGWEGDSSWLAAPFVGDAALKGMAVIHLVRHPKDTVDSMLRMIFFTHPRYGPFFKWGCQYLPEINEYDTPEEKAACWYVGFNEMIEPYAHYFHRVEDDVRILLDELGIEYEGKELFDNKKYNTRPGFGPSDVDLNALPDPLRTRLHKTTLRYGYEWPEKFAPPSPTISQRWQRFRKRLERH